MGLTTNGSQFLRTTEEILFEEEGNAIKIHKRTFVSIIIVQQLEKYLHLMPTAVADIEIAVGFSNELVLNCP